MAGKKKGKKHSFPTPGSTGRDEPARCRYQGLQNQGATCYLNSVLQVLFLTKDFREAVRRRSSPEWIDRHLASFFHDLEKRTAHTSAITKLFNIKVHVQSDAAECLEKILTRTSPEASQIFQGQLRPRSTCSGCGTHTDTEEPFWFLPLTLLDSAEDYRLADGIQEFFRPSGLTGKDQIYCERCQAKADATIKVEMKQQPEVLTLLLKRFTFDYRCRQYVKIRRRANIPFRLTIENQAYTLYAFVEHYGDLKKGHYTVTINSPDDEKWYHFSDTRVKRLSFQPFQVDNNGRYEDAYLLFYRKEKPGGQAAGGSEVGASVAESLKGSGLETEEGEETAATAKVKNDTGNPEGSVAGDEPVERHAAADGGGELTTPTEAKVETASGDAAADKKSPEPIKTLTKVCDFIKAGFGCKKLSLTNPEVKIEMKSMKPNKEKETNNEKAEGEDDCPRAKRVQITDDGRSDDIEKRSGEKSVAEEQVRRDPPQGGGGENHLHKPNYQKVCGVASYGSDLGWNEDRKEELMEVQTGDEAPSGPESVCGRQSAEGQDDGQSEGDQPERRQEDLRGATRGEDSEERRENAQGESGAAGELNAPAGVQDNVMSKGSVVRRGRTTQEETGGQKRSERREERGAGVRQATDEVASLSERFQTNNVTDSASTGTENTTWSTSGARGSRHGSQSLPALGIGQQPQWVLNLPPTQHLSPGGIIPQQPPIVTQGHVPCVTGVPPMLVQPTGPPGLPPPYSNGPESYQVVSMAPPQHLSAGVIPQQPPILTQIPHSTGLPSNVPDAPAAATCFDSAPTQTELHSHRIENGVLQTRVTNQKPGGVQCPAEKLHTGEEPHTQIAPADNSESPLSHTSTTPSSERKPENVQPQAKREARCLSVDRESETAPPEKDGGRQTSRRRTEETGEEEERSPQAGGAEESSSGSCRASAEPERQVCGGGESKTDEERSGRANDKGDGKVSDPPIAGRKREQGKGGKKESNTILRFGLSLHNKH